MKWNQIEAGWKSYTANARQQGSKLTDEYKEESDRQIFDWQSCQIEQPLAAQEHRRGR